MFHDLKVRLILIILLSLSATYFLWPTYEQYYTDKSMLSEIQKQELKSKSIKLGLDLQGGMYVLLELDLPILVEITFIME